MVTFCRLLSSWNVDLPAVLLFITMIVIYSAITGSAKRLNHRKPWIRWPNAPASGLYPRFVSSSWIDCCKETISIYPSISKYNWLTCSAAARSVPIVRPKGMLLCLGKTVGRRWTRLQKFSSSASIIVLHNQTCRQALVPRFKLEATISLKLMSSESELRFKIFVI